MTENASPPPFSIRDRLRRLGLTLGILLLAWLALTLLGPRLLAPPPPPPPMDAPPPRHQPPPNDDAVDMRVRQLEDRLRMMEEPPPPPPETAAAPPPEQIDRLARLEAEVEAQRAALADITQRMQESADHLAAVTAFYQLKEVVMRGEPFRHHWDRLNDLVRTHPEWEAPLSALAPYADAGVPTLETLKAEFTATLPAALGDETATSVASALQSLIRIRKVGAAQKGDDDESVIARAEAKLERGDVSQSFTELGALSPKASDRFAAWKEQAQAYVIARKSLEALPPALLQGASPSP